MTTLHYPDNTATRNTTKAVEVVTDGVEFWGGTQKLRDDRNLLTASAATVTIVEYGVDIFHQSVVTLADVSVTAANTTGVSFGGTKIVDFPEARVAVLGSTLSTVTCDLTDAGNATPVDGDDNGDIAIGTTVAGDGTLSAADVNLIPSTAFAFDTSGVSAALAAAAQFDGTTTAIDAYLNCLVDDADVADTASDVLLFSGVWTVTWLDLGDY